MPMTPRRLALVAVMTATIVQVGFLAVYFAYLGRGVIESSPPQPPLPFAIGTFLRVASFPGNYIPEHYYPYLPVGGVLGPFFILQVLCWSLAVWLLLVVAQQLLRLLHGRRSKAAA